MQFTKYQSIENAYNKKLIQIIFDHGLAPDDGTAPYIVTEKVHGSNFGIHMDVTNGKLEYSKRSGFIGEGNFMGHLNIVESLVPLCDKLYAALGDYVKESIVIHAEIYGGIWQGESETHATKVQREVEYSKSNHIACFDLEIDGGYVAPIEAFPILQACGFPMVPIIGVYNSLRDALEVENTFDSLVPGRHLLKAEEGKNLAEGVVIRPFNRIAQLSNGKRVILKNVSQSFRENNGKVAAAPKELSQPVKDLIQVTSPYLNANRLTHVLSKDTFTQKDFGKVMGLLVQDALEDYIKECTEFEAVKGLKDLNESADWKSFVREYNKLASQVVRGHWELNEF